MTAVQPEASGFGGLGLMDGLATPLWLVDLEGTVLWLNQAGRGVLDLTVASMPGASRALLPPEAVGALTLGAPVSPVETRVVFRGPRSEVAVDARLSLAPPDLAFFPSPRSGPRSDQRRLVLIEGVGDAAARHEIIRLTEQLVALSYAYPDLRFELRRDGTILDFAAACPADLNIPAERFLHNRVQAVLPEPAASLVAGAMAALDAGETVAGVDFVLAGPQGERAFEARLVALMDGERVMCSIRNVTTRVEAERRARAAHDLLIDAIESISGGFVVYDRDDRLVVSNSRYRELYALSAEAMRPGASFEEVLRFGALNGQYRVAPENLEAWIADRLERHRARPLLPFEHRLSDGRWIRVEERATRDGGTVGVRSDISDLKRREEELSAAHDEAERANRRKSDYVHHLSHELRTPLNAVMGFAQILAEEMMGPLGSERYRDYARQIATAGTYMLDLINNLLDLAKIEAGRMTLSEEPCDIGMLVDMTFAMMSGRAADAGVTLVQDLPEDLPPVVGDMTLMRQMLTNLVGNAVKFARRAANPTVLVRAVRQPDGALWLEVVDNGIGMAPEHIPHALDAFGQVHERAATSERGSGLGLPLTVALIGLHGGSLGVDSRLGEGTTIRLILPAWRVGPLMNGEGI